MVYAAFSFPSLHIKTKNSSFRAIVHCSTVHRNASATEIFVYPLNNFQLFGFADGIIILQEFL